MTIPAGYQTRAAFRLVGYSNTALAYPTELGTPTPDTLGAFDLLPFLGESIGLNQEWQADETLEGHAGVVEHHNVSRLPSGSIKLGGRFLGLNQLILACMGHEPITNATRNGFGDMPWKRYGGAAPASGTVQSATNDTLTTGVTFDTNVVGEFVRYWDYTPLKHLETRRIIARPSSTQIQVSPAWTVNPTEGDGYIIARAFAHTYEMSHNMHQDLLRDIEPNLHTDWAGYITRWGVLGIDKGQKIWEWQAVYVESLSFELSKDGMQITAELRPFWVEFDSAINTDPTLWTFHPETYAVTQRILFADCKFRLGAHAAADLDDDDNLGITSLKFTIKNNLDADLQTLASGLYREEPARGGKREVTGSFEIPRHKVTTWLDSYVAGDLLMGELLAEGPSLDGHADDVAMFRALFRALKLEKADANVDDGPAIFGETYNFRCLQPPSASGSTWPTPSTGAENSELMIQTHDNCPFNYLLGQHTSAY